MGGGAEFDLAALYRALDEAREAHGLSWQALTQRINAQFSGAGARPMATSTLRGLMLTGLARAQRVGLPGVMAIVGWVGRPAADFTRASAG